MARSDEVMVLFDYLVEDIVSCTDLERVLVLRLEGNECLESQVFYGFQEVNQQPFHVPFARVNGLLRKVYTDREPLSVIGFGDLPRRSNSRFRFTCGILRDDYRDGHCHNRRQRINLCVADIDSKDIDLRHYSRFRHFSVMNMDAHDKTIRFLLGDVNSFLILPICDDHNFYGYVLADKFFSREPVSYEEIRLSAAIASHSALAVGRAFKHKKMVQKIARQLGEIEHLKSFYESIIQNLRSGLLTLDQSMQITDVNRAAEQILGYNREEILAKPLENLIDTKQNNKKCFFQDLVDEVDNSMGFLSEIAMRKKSGELFPSEVCFSVITNSNGEVIGLSCIFRDITTKKVLEQDLARMDKLASLGEMAAGVAHEIKNPLAGISGAMQILGRSFEDDDTSRMIFDEVLSQVKRLDNFVNELLQFAKPGQSCFDALQLDRIIEKVLFLVASQLEEKRIIVYRDFERNPPAVKGDAGQLQQVFLNIILNAIDAMDVEGVLTIHSCWETDSANCKRNDCMSPVCRTANGHLRVAIQDNGRGIDREELETIFNPFHTTKSNGTGLGLSISHRILEQHGGSIFVESEPGSGSTFIVCLPVYHNLIEPI